MYHCNRSVSSVAKRTLLVREVWGSVPRPVKSDTVTPTARHQFLRSCVVQALNRGDGSATRYTLRHNTASVMKIWFFMCLCASNQKSNLTWTEGITPKRVTSGVSISSAQRLNNTVPKKHCSGGDTALDLRAWESNPWLPTYGDVLGNWIVSRFSLCALRKWC